MLNRSDTARYLLEFFVAGSQSLVSSLRLDKETAELNKWQGGEGET